MTYREFKSELKNHGIFLLYGDSYGGNQFQVSFLGDIKEGEITLLKSALVEILNKK